MRVDGFQISADSPVYLIAEMSANHNGSIENAFKTIDAAKLAGANAIKSQTYTPDTLTIKSKRPEFYLNGGLWDGSSICTICIKTRTLPMTGMHHYSHTQNNVASPCFQPHSTTQP